MSTTSMNISLPEKLKKKVAEIVEQGNFSNPSDYMRHLIRKDLEENEAKEKAFEELRQLIKEGEKGEATPFSMNEIIKSAKEKMGV